MNDMTDEDVYKWLCENPKQGYSSMMQAGFASEWAQRAKPEQYMNLIVSKGDAVINIHVLAKKLGRGMQFWLSFTSGKMKSDISMSKKEFIQFVMDNQ